jgi:hypothetical protein
VSQRRGIKARISDIRDLRAALDHAQKIARAHGDDCRLAFRKADRALDRLALLVVTCDARKR